MVSCMAGQASSGYRERNSTADRALDILLLFSDDRLVLGGQEVADRLGVSRSTAYRYLQSLVSSGFIEETKPSGFRLGSTVFELARLARKGLGLSEVSRPIMRELVEEVGETVLLTRLSGSHVVCLEREEAGHPVRLSYERGHVLPVNAGAAALVLLAWTPRKELADIVRTSGLPPLTEATVTDERALHQRLEAIRRDGFAVTRGELDAEVMGLAAPIRDADGTVVAAISIAALAYRVPEERVAEVATAVQAAAGRISARLRVIEG